MLIQMLIECNFLFVNYMNIISQEIIMNSFLLVIFTLKSLTFMMKNKFCLGIFCHILFNSVYHVCLLRAHILCQISAFQLFFLLPCVSLPDFGPSFTQTIKWVAECFVELLAFCEVLVFRNTCYVRVAIVQEVCCAPYHSHIHVTNAW